MTFLGHIIRREKIELLCLTGMYEADNEIPWYYTGGLRGCQR